MKPISTILIRSLFIIFIFLNSEKIIAQVDISPQILSKIKFDLSVISPEGLIGNPDGLRSVTYEFCIPNRTETIEEVSTIDNQIIFLEKSPGRIGCQSHEILALGSTHDPRWQEILIQLAHLDYINLILEYHGE